MDFIRNPLEFIDRAFSDGRQAAWLPGRQLCIADPEIGRSVLWDRERRFHDTSDFFGSPDGALAPRSAQIEIGAAAREAFKDSLDLSESGQWIRNLPASSEWPAKGNELLYDLLKPSFVAAERTVAFRTLVDTIVRRRIFRQKQGWWSLGETNLRPRFEAAIEAERARIDSAAIDDLLAMLFRVAPQNSAAQLGAAYVSMLFAMVGSTGFALGWSLYLADVHGKHEADSSHIVLEALRLYPVAWLLGRRPRVEMTLLGETVMPGDTVVVCPYAIHRNPLHWRSPLEFLPERWADKRDRVAWLPFGAGSHSCVAVALTLNFVAQFIGALQIQKRWSVESLGHEIGLGPALRPPKFKLHIGERLAVNASF